MHSCPRRTTSLKLSERIAIKRLSLATTTADNALQTAIGRLASLFTADILALLCEPLARATGFGYSHEGVVCRRPALADSVQATSSNKGASAGSPAWPSTCNLALWREVCIIFVGHAQSAPRAYFGNGINGIPNLRIDGSQYGGEGEVVGCGQLLAPACQTC